MAYFLDNTLFTLLVHCKGYICAMKNWTASSSLDLISAKPDPQYKDKAFQTYVGSVIVAYQKEIKGEKDSDMFPSPKDRPEPESLDYTGKLSAAQQETVALILQALKHTRFPWKEKDFLSSGARPEALINTIASWYHCQADCKLLLSTQEGWNMRVVLEQLLSRTNANWTWWDGFATRPKISDDKCPDLLVRMGKETDKLIRNHALQVNRVEQIRQQSNNVIKTVFKTIMTEHLGYLKYTLPSMHVVQAMDDLIKVNENNTSTGYFSY